MEKSGQLHAPGSFTPRKEPQVLIGKEAGWAPEPVWTTWSREKSIAPAGNRTLAVQPLAYRPEDSTLYNHRCENFISNGKEL
jgi:hypothetical protein